MALANRIFGCGKVITQVSTKDGYTVLEVNEGKKVELDAYPILHTKITTNILLGKNYKPMQGYTSIKMLVINSKEECVGDPESDGTCTEKVSGCKFEKID